MECHAAFVHNEKESDCLCKTGLKAANGTKFPEPADDEAIDNSWWVKDRHEATCRLIVHMPLGCSMVLVSIQSRKRFY